MVAFLSWQTSLGFPLETDILKLLPQTQADPLTEQAYRQFESAAGRKTVFMVGHADGKVAKKGAEQLFSAMNNSGLFSEISYRIQPERAEKTYQIYSPHRHSLLSAEHREALLKDRPDLLSQQALKTLTSPISVSSASLTDDPLFTFLEFLKELQSQAGSFTIEGDLLLADFQDKKYVILVGALEDNAFSLSAQSRFKAFDNQARLTLKSTDPALELLSAGVIHHAIAGTDSARQDISTIGLGSLLGLILLILLAFRSLNPLWVSVIPILAGCTAALCACIWIFGNVHLFTLVFGSSLIGVSIDYSFHYLAERQSAGPDWDPQLGLKHILPGVTLGLLTSLAAYLALAVAPFSGLQQIAIFSAVGLLSAFLTVVLWYPIFLKKGVQRHKSITFLLSQSYVELWQRHKPRHWPFGCVMIGLALTAYLFTHLAADDDIRSLQSSPERIVSEENLVKDIVGTSSGSQFFVVRGATEDEVLTTEERLTEILDEQVQQQYLKRYRAISKVLPSPSRQKENYRLLQKQVLSPNSVLVSYLEEMEFEQEIIDNYRLAFQDDQKPVLTVNQWLESPLKDLYAALWMPGNDEGEHASIVILDGVKDVQHFQTLAEQIPQATFVSRADDISGVLKTYRELSSWLVAAAYGTIFLMLLFRYPWRLALTVILPPLIAGLAAVAVSTVLGVTLNLFNTLALVLVLGIGIDYTIFFAEQTADKATTMHAILLSAVTTILSFGLLALSGTPVISSFGLMVFVGIVVSLLLSPLV